MADNYGTKRLEDPTLLGTVLSEWTVGATELTGDIRAVMFNADGTCDLTNQDDTTEAGVPVIKMQPLPVVPKKVTAMATATKCYVIK